MPSADTRRSRRGLLSAALNHRLARFLLVGGGAAVMEFAAFDALIVAHLWPALASVLSFAIGMTASFVGYRNWTFSGDQDLPMRSQFGAYLVLASINAAIAATLIQLMVAHGLRAWIAKLIMMAAVACWNFLILDRFVFRRSRNNDSGSQAPDRVASV